jgi:hypothetical protein
MVKPQGKAGLELAVYVLPLQVTDEEKGEA